MSHSYPAADALIILYIPLKIIFLSLLLFINDNSDIFHIILNPILLKA